MGAAFLMGTCLATPDTLLACILTSVYTLLYWYYGQAVAVNVSWNVISMGVVFPITVSIGMAFKRREQVRNLHACLSSVFRA